MGDNMCQCKTFTIHAIGIGALMASFAYIYLNETGKLNKIKRLCMNKAQNIKEDLKEKLD